MQAPAVLASLELAAERAIDVAPLVYDRLFAAHADMLPLFVRDRNGAVRGEMLSRSLEALLDFLEADSYASNFFRCEVVTHEGYGVPRAIFPAFYAALRDSLRDLLADAWSRQMEQEWQSLLDRLAAIIAEPFLDAG